ncbi:hypothetical protein M5689_013051 [Euphorbia peplus]|nr:hypothetical protein M5689_013050 [Euphorbia peplus]WCJ31568.1 hypothetical protein M5689_013051 [Euphorbia peplus]
MSSVGVKRKASAIGDNVTRAEVEFTELNNLSGPVVSSQDTKIAGDTSPNPTNKRSRSCVWDHFKKILDSKGIETGRVTCVWCDGNYQGKSESGTSSLWKHLRETCKKFPHKKDLVEAQKKKDKSQTTLQFHKATDTKNAQLVCFRFDQETCRRSLVKMIIVDELPFRTVEKCGFKEFCAENIPEFRIPSRRTIARDCFSLFSKEK